MSTLEAHARAALRKQARDSEPGLWVSFLFALLSPAAASGPPRGENSPDVGLCTSPFYVQAKNSQCRVVTVIPRGACGIEIIKSSQFAVVTIKTNYRSQRFFCQILEIFSKIREKGWKTFAFL